MSDSPDFGSLMVKGFVVYGIVWLVTRILANNPGLFSRISYRMSPYANPFPIATKNAARFGYWCSVGVYVICSAMVSGRDDAQSWAWNSAVVSFLLCQSIALVWLKRQAQKSNHD
jgi:hypothetical protein